MVFFFEDEKSDAIYERLISRLFPQSRRFRVVSLGGKEKVIAKARSPRRVPIQCIFVVDKDFDDILGRMVMMPDLFYWDRHCFENFLLELRALCDICVEERADELTDQAAAARMQGSEEFLARLVERYTKLTRLFIVARRFRVHVETTKRHIDDILDGADKDYPLPTEDRIAAFRAELKVACQGDRDKDWLIEDVALDTQLERAFAADEGHEPLSHDITSHLNGKHLFLILRDFVGHRLGFEFSELNPVSLYTRLIAKVPLAPFGTLQRQLAARYDGLLGAPAVEA